MKGLFKVFLFGMLSALCVIAALAVAIFAKYLSTAPDEKLPGIELRQGRDAGTRIGDPATFEAEFDCAWGTVPRKIEAVLPEGLQQIGSGAFSFRGAGWGRWTWRAELVLQAFRPGEYADVSGIAEFTSKDSRHLRVPVKLQKFSVGEIQVADDAEIKIAGRIEEKNTPSRKLIAGTAAAVLLLAVAAIAIFATRKRREERKKPLPFWHAALDALRELRISQERGLLDSRSCVARLSDIIRGFLERRFGMDAPTMTTPEFLESLGRADSPLSAQQKGFLSDFMLSAELVKFADMPAETDVIEKAISDAERLVRESIPKTESVKSEI